MQQQGFILVVEDDPQQSESIKRAIESRYPQYAVSRNRKQVSTVCRGFGKVPSIPTMVICE